MQTVCVCVVYVCVCGCVLNVYVWLCSECICVCAYVYVFVCVCMCVFSQNFQPTIDIRHHTSYIIHHTSYSTVPDCIITNRTDNNRVYSDSVVLETTSNNVRQLARSACVCVCVMCVCVCVCVCAYVCVRVFVWHGAKSIDTDRRKREGEEQWKI